MKCPHCDVHVDEHEASRCLDAWIAEAVMDLCSHYLEFEWTDKDDRYCKCGKCGEVIKNPELKFYSTSIEAAWEVLEIISRNHLIALTGYLYDGRENYWSLTIRGEVDIKAPTVELGICRAAIKAVNSAR